jgi:hypothetical protein
MKGNSIFLKYKIRPINRMGNIMRIYQEREIPSKRFNTLIMTKHNSGTWMFDVHEMDKIKRNKLKKLSNNIV